jgi:hypothetical protein
VGSEFVAGECAVEKMMAGEDLMWKEDLTWKGSMGGQMAGG